MVVFFLRGGAGKKIPKYQEPKNSPFAIKPTGFKKDNTFTKKPFTKRPFTKKPFERKPMVNFQLYEPQRKPPPPRSKKPLDTRFFIPSHTNVPHYPPQFNLWNPNHNLPIVKHYTITGTGPLADHARLNNIYEDILPEQEINDTFNTVNERINIYDFIRSVYVRQDDGESIALGGKIKHNLLSYLKFMELNPYSTYQFSLNPYKGLPDGMLIYRSCYPIRYNKNTHGVDCARDSLGMNIRIYRLTDEEYNVRQIRDDSYDNHDVWREIAYYEYVRENIIKPKICPNFALLYAYFISEKSNIDFERLNQLRGKYRLNKLQQLQAQSVKRKGLSVPINIKGSSNKLFDIKKPSYMTGGNPEKIKKLNLNTYTGKSLVALTEAPNSNLYTWASKVYNVQGNIQRMISHGFHRSEVWISIIFQLMAAMYTMQIHKISINEFSIKDNVYIKNTNKHENMTRYWKYKINGLDYYIPNYGYVLVVDTNFKDIHVPKLLNINQKPIFKINGPFYKQNTYKDEEMQDIIFKQFIDAVRPDTFSNAFTNTGGNRPSEVVINMLQRIQSHAHNTIANTTKDIGDCIFYAMKQFLNNRIGTYLKESEIKNIRQNETRNFKSGDIVIHATANNTYKFVLFKNESITNPVKIVTKDDDNADLYEKDVEIGGLYHYSANSTIIQNYDANKTILSDEKLLEVYIINKK